MVKGGFFRVNKISALYKTTVFLTDPFLVGAIGESQRSY